MNSPIALDEGDMPLDASDEVPLEGDDSMEFGSDDLADSGSVELSQEEVSEEELNSLNNLFD